MATDPVDKFVAQLANDLLPALAKGLRVDGNGLQLSTLLAIGDVVDALAQMMREHLVWEHG